MSLLLLLFFGWLGPKGILVDVKRKYKDVVNYVIVIAVVFFWPGQSCPLALLLFLSLVLCHLIDF